MDAGKQKMKARIRRRKQTEADIEAIEPDKYTEKTCGLPPASLRVSFVNLQLRTRCLVPKS
jgi:hypothetical protein